MGEGITMALTGKITSQLSWTQYQTTNFGINSNANIDNTTLILNSGTGIGQINQLWYSTLSGNQTLDLSSLSQNIFNGKINISFTNGDIKGIIINLLDSGNSGVFTLPFSSSQGNIILAPSGTTLLGTGSGWNVNPGDTINITMTDTGNYNIAIIGVG